MCARERQTHTHRNKDSMEEVRKSATKKEKIFFYSDVLRPTLKVKRLPL